MALQHPQVGCWYHDQYSDMLFEVVALDDDNGTVEIQYSSGDIDEIDMEDWDQHFHAPAAPPKDTDTVYDMSDEDWTPDEATTDHPFHNDLSRYNLDAFADFDEI